jgi:ubiquinone/menaquinone biosynthesis C-methylase UbiE
VITAVHRQFGHPRGPLGTLVGWLMAVKNGRRSRWALALLAARPGERVLEVGFGPGVDVQRLAAAVGAEGRVAGVDVSALMVARGRRRNRALVEKGLVDLRRGGAEGLPFEAGAFDAAYSVNSAQFWTDAPLAFREVRRVLRRGGRAVIVVQPMEGGATRADSEAWLERLARPMAESGLAVVRQELGPFEPPPAAVVGLVAG